MQPDNPYFHWGPITDQRCFCDREEEINQVLESVNHGQCVSLVGLRKMGKTSLLYRLRALNGDESLGVHRGYVYVYVDGQAHQATQPSEFYLEVLDGICTVLTQEDRLIRPAERPQEGMEYIYFRRAVRSLIRRGIKPIILIDEFEILGENHNFGLAFFNGLRSLAALGVVYVTASKRRLFQLEREKKILGSPFFNVFRTLYVDLFDTGSALELISEPSTEHRIHFDQQTAAEIFRLAGRHPFFLQRVCHIAFEISRVRKGALRRKDLEQIRVKSQQELEDQMTSYWEDVGPEEREILLKVAKDEALQQDSEVTLENLVRQCLLVRENGAYQVFSALFKDYVRAQPRSGLSRPQGWLDRFQIKEELGRGAMSIVYRAYQPALDRDVVIKELRPQADTLEEYAERFRHEARSIARLDHPNILPVYDFYPEVDRAYIVMKYASGGALANRLAEAEGTFDPVEAVEIVIYIGRALEYAHRQEVIHRDIKPANIFMGGADWPLLGDFGLALSRGEAPARGSGMTGSSDYVSPEQAMDARDADHLSDIYSLGVVLYHLLVGEVPYAEVTSAGDRLIKRLTQGVPSPRSRNPQIPVEMEQIVLKATASNPNDRYQTAESMVADLEHAKLIYAKSAKAEARDAFREGPLDAAWREHLSAQQGVIAEEFERISRMEPRPRGRAFQKLFARIVEQHGWSQEEGVCTSHEEIDVIVYRGQDYYLVECKWEKDSIQANVVRELHGKLSNRAGVRGVVASMSGFTGGAKKQVEDYGNDRVILLFGPEDVRSMVFDGAAFDELLDAKLRALVTRRKTIFS